ncbi:MAG TPA: NDP-hexose 2,3-dehydratase family protein, partial [Coriobacteriia bacterium]|nr:NDP-hexose 2,3-dehydratase family protein [Coriobacteriia bacterium]
MTAEVLAPFVKDLAVPDELARIREWRESLSTEQYANIRRTPLEEVVGWDTGCDLPAFRHHSSKFFSVVGIEVQSQGPEGSWMQPMIDQPEVGLL